MFLFNSQSSLLPPTGGSGKHHSDAHYNSTPNVAFHLDNQVGTRWIFIARWSFARNVKLMRVFPACKRLEVYCLASIELGTIDQREVSVVHTTRSWENKIKEWNQCRAWEMSGHALMMFCNQQRPMIDRERFAPARHRRLGEHRSVDARVQRSSHPLGCFLFHSLIWLSWSMRNRLKQTLSRFSSPIATALFVRHRGRNEWKRVSQNEENE